MRTLSIRRGTWLIGAALVFAGSGPATPLQAQEEAAAPDPQELSVELVIATAVEDREPVGAGETFPADVGQLFAWMRVTNGADSTLRVVWTHGDHRSEVPLQVGGSPWRTWSSKQIPPDWTGSWTVEVQDADGTVVASTTFTVEAAG
jgi:hypothetical protein